MTHDELAGYALVAGYAVMLVAAIKVFGLRRVVMVVFGIVFVAVTIAFKTLSGIGSPRRY